RVVAWAITAREDATPKANALAPVSMRRRLMPSTLSIISSLDNGSFPSGLAEPNQPGFRCEAFARRHERASGGATMGKASGTWRHGRYAEGCKIFRRKCAYLIRKVRNTIENL